MDFVDFENLLYQEHWAKVDLYMYTVTVVLGGFIHLLLFVLNSFILLRSGKYLFPYFFLFKDTCSFLFLFNAVFHMCTVAAVRNIAFQS